MSRLVEPADYAAFLRRSIRAMGRRVAEADPVALAQLCELRQALDAAEDEAMSGLAAQGFSYTEMARPLGITRQAARQRALKARTRE